MRGDWESTKLWALVQQKSEKRDGAAHILQSWMPRIETTLRHAATVPLDFTLHDADHSFRVAERMVQLLSTKVQDKIGTFECSLLLMAAYLHDIGMAPTRTYVDGLNAYLMTNNSGSLSPDEEADFRSWLDYEWPDIKVPLASDAMTLGDIRISEEIIAYYIRHRHNDLSEAWIRTNLTGVEPALYTGWVNDLVILCRSHHDGLQELKAEKFNSRLIGSLPQVVNLRYLAALLRLADVLEFDPERTPPVILRHRDIVPKSRIYWWKDQYISLMADANTGQVLFTARTPNSKIHRAVIETASAIDAEFQCCNLLHQDGQFKRGRVPEHARDYDWPWPSAMTLDISEADNSFIYIDGTFRPNVQRMLRLLSGTALYGDPLASVRELLQNAFDAVKEQIGYERLEEPDPSLPSLQFTIGNRHRVSLTLSSEGQTHYLTCRDDGVGMTKEIIERHLLVSGSPPPPGVRHLDRMAKSYGFSLGRTGEFGIGVLSYFMIADELVITTRRSLEAGADPTNLAWRFETEGVGAFGQLTPIAPDSRGTTVRLRLRPEIVGADPNSWFQHLAHYTADFLAHLPCRFDLERDGVGTAVMQLEAGWSKTTVRPELLSKLIAPPSRGPEVKMTPTELEERDRNSRRRSELLEKALLCMRIFGPREGKLPDGLGTFRVYLPYFDLNAGASLLFADESNEGFQAIDIAPDTDPSDAGQFVWTTSYVLNSWNGFYADIDKPFTSRFLNLGVIEVNWESGCDISVNRNRMTLQESARQALNQIAEVQQTLMLQFLEEHDKSPFGALNRSLVPMLNDKWMGRLPKNFMWPEPPRRRDDGVARFGLHSTEFPIVRLWNDEPIALSDAKQRALKAHGYDALHFVSLAGGNIFGPRYNVSSTTKELLSPACALPDTGFILIKNGWKLRIHPKWGLNAGTSASSEMTDFPPEWSGVWVVEGSNYFFANRQHPLSQRLLEGGVSIARDQDLSLEESTPDVMLVLWLLHMFRSSNDRDLKRPLELEPTLRARFLSILQTSKCLPLRWIRLDAGTSLIFAGLFDVTNTGDFTGTLSHGFLMREDGLGPPLKFSDDVEVGWPTSPKWLIELDGTMGG